MPLRRSAIALPVALLMAGSLAVACSSDVPIVGLDRDPPVPPSEPPTEERPVGPGSTSIAREGRAQLEIGRTLALGVTVRDAGGAVVALPQLRWTSLAPTVATVAPDGVVTGHAPGTAPITVASACCGSDTLQVDVVAPAPPVGTLAIEPEAPVLERPGDGQFLTVRAHAANGARILAAAPVWESLAPEVVSITPEGYLEALAPGEALVAAATSCCGSDTVRVLVAPPPPPEPGVRIHSEAETTLPVGGALTLSVTALDPAGAPVPGAVFTWESRAASVATVDPSGRVVGRTPGVALVVVESDCCGADSVEVVVLGDDPPGPGLPPPPPPDGSLWFEERWSYASTADLRAHLIWAYGAVTLEHGLLPDGTTGPFVRTVYRGGDHEEHAGVNVDVPQAVEARPRELWGEVWVRFDSAWRIQTDDKTFFVLEDWRHVPRSELPPEVRDTPDETRRWALDFASSYAFGGPYFRLEVFPETGTSFLEDEVWNGEWGRIRFHFRMASDEEARDGIYELWWNGRKIADYHGIRTDSHPEAYFRVLGLGRNANMIPGTGTRDWGPIRLYLGDPGW